MRTVGSYEAKTHLPRLLEEVAGGEEITITKHGVPVAVLVPPPEGRHGSVRQTIEEIKEFRKGKTLGGLKVKDLVEEGRRF